MLTISFVFLCLVQACFSAQVFEGDQVLRVFHSNEKHEIILKDLLRKYDTELDIWQERQFPNASIDVHVPSNKLQVVKTVLNSNGIKFIVFIDDLENIIDEESKSNQQNAFAYGFDYEKYNRYPAITKELQSLARNYPSKVKLFNVGRSYEKREMIGVKISNGYGTKPIVWIDGGIHAREWISPATVMYFIRELVKSDSNEVYYALKEYDFHILPVFNVDGYEYTHTSTKARTWRKTMSKGIFCTGSDPNRNWDWDFGGVGTSIFGCKDTYPGNSAFSEIEVKNVADYLSSIKKRLKSYWSLHAYSQLVLTPWSYKKELPKDYDEIVRVGKVFAKKIYSYYRRSYTVGPPSRILYPASGSSMDWVYGKLGVKYSYSLELRDKGRYGFLLPASQIKESGRETTAALLAAVDAMK